MNNLVMLCVLLAVAGCHLPVTQKLQGNSQQFARESKRGGRKWRPAHYRGLTMGASTRSDMLRVLGKPKWSELFDEDKSTPEVWYHYEGSGELPGETVINVDKCNGIILRMHLHPEKLSKGEAIKHFGDDYVMTRYKLCKGFEDEESAPLYETPDGRFVFLEYRERGIAVALDKDGNVTHISYTSEPIGAQSSKCE